MTDGVLFILVIFKSNFGFFKLITESCYQMKDTRCIKIERVKKVVVI